MRLSDTEGWQELDRTSKAAVVAYLAAEYVFIAAMPLALVTALADSRLGAYVLVAAVTLHIVGRQLALFVFAVHHDDLYATAAERHAWRAGMASMLVLIGGLCAALGHWGPGAVLAVVGLVGLLASHLAVGGLLVDGSWRRPGRRSRRSRTTTGSYAMGSRGADCEAPGPAR